MNVWVIELEVKTLCDTNYVHYYWKTKKIKGEKFLQKDKLKVGKQINDISVMLENKIDFFKILPTITIWHFLFDTWAKIPCDFWNVQRDFMCSINRSLSIYSLENCGSKQILKFVY